MEIQQSAQQFTGVAGKNVSALAKTGKALQKILTQLATSQRINSAADDAAGLGVSEQLRSQVRGFKMASRNIADATSALNVGDGAASSIGDLLARNRELSLQASNDTLNDKQRQGLDVEFQQNLTEIDRIATGTRFNNQTLLDSQGLGSGDALIAAGANAGEKIAIPQMSMGLDPLGLKNISIGTADGARSSIALIDEASSKVQELRTTIGSLTNRLGYANNALATAEINTQAAESLLRDQDMAAGVAELTRQRLLEQTGVAAFSRFNEISANHIISLLKQ